MENANPKSKKKRREDRIVVNPESVSRINEWLLQIERNGMGVRVSRDGIADFVLSKYPRSLSQADIKELRERHFDEVDFTSWALRQLKEAKDRGESLTLEQLIQHQEKGNTTPIKTKAQE